MERCLQIERSIITTYRKWIWSRFVKAVKEYELVQEGDRIAVCISGGKDSMLLAKCMQELQRHGEKNFELQFIVMDPGYAPQNRELIENNARLLQIPVHIFETQIFDAVFEIQKNPCYLCARMRRGYLYEEAQRLGCNKIALGHHFDDVIETILMGMLYGAQMQSMPPKLWSTNHKGMQLIRPLYYVHEETLEYSPLTIARYDNIISNRLGMARDAVDDAHQHLSGIRHSRAAGVDHETFRNDLRQPPQGGRGRDSERQTRRAGPTARRGDRSHRHRTQNLQQRSARP